MSSPYEGKVKKWITVNGAHIPIYFGESSDDAISRHFGKKDEVKVGDKQVQVSKQKAFDPEDVTEELIVREIAGEDSYANTPEYRDLMTQHSENEKKIDKLDAKIEKLNKQLEKESTPKPEEEWTADEKWTAEILGKRFVKAYNYTEKGEQLNEQLSQLEAQKKELEQRRSELNKQIKEHDDEQYSKQRMKYLQDAKVGDIRPASQDEYQGFKKDHTGVYDSMLKSGEAELLEMSPKIYLQEVAHRIFQEATLETALRGTSVASIKKYMKMMQDGVKFDTPYLNYTNAGQEGRHRAIAAYLLGIETIPVAVIKRRRY